MKYLKTYKIFENLENEFINWDLISTAKELSLDELDNGLSLEFNVDYTKGGGISNILSGYFSHTTDKVKWGKNFNKDGQMIKTQDLDESYISYSFYFNKIDDYINYAEQSEDMIDRLKSMYPDVNLTNDRFANYPPVQALRQHLISEHELDEKDIYSLVDTGYNHLVDTGYNHYDGRVYDFEGMEFISVTYRSAMNVAREYVESLDDQKILNVDLYFRFDCVDEDSLVDSLVDEQYYRQDWEYIEDIKADEDGNIDENSLKDYMDQEKENIKYDIEDHIKTYFGKESLYDMIKDHLHHDWLNRMTEALVDADGLGHMISGYDGKEHIEEYNGTQYHIFRIN